jgi:hypothetical protein
MGGLLSFAGRCADDEVAPKAADRFTGWRADLPDLPELSCP